MKQYVFVAALLVALSAFAVSRLVAPIPVEARMTLYQRRPWRK